MEWPGRITPGSKFCRYERPSAERRSCGPVFLCPRGCSTRVRFRSGCPSATGSPPRSNHSHRYSTAARVLSDRWRAKALWPRNHRRYVWRQRPAPDKTRRHAQAQRRSRREKLHGGLRPRERQARPDSPEPELPRLPHRQSPTRCARARTATQTSAHHCGSQAVADTAATTHPAMRPQVLLPIAPRCRRFRVRP